ncbi:MAG TPA: hypothetical protein ENJ37_05695 [Deltaproteobacteria bacterium]|nr:hypothetical protein [Deltaproteobacteria bacterium]
MRALADIFRVPDSRRAAPRRLAASLFAASAAVVLWAAPLHALQGAGEGSAPGFDFFGEGGAAGPAAPVSRPGALSAYGPDAAGLAAAEEELLRAAGSAAARTAEQRAGWIALRLLLSGGEAARRAALDELDRLGDVSAAGDFEGLLALGEALSLACAADDSHCPGLAAAAERMVEDFVAGAGVAAREAEGAVDIGATAQAALLVLRAVESGAPLDAEAAAMLDFLAVKGVGGDGAFHLYYADRDEPWGDGRLDDNAWTALALARGYELLGDDDYLSAALKAARFMAGALYDTKLGGFMAKNSPSPRFYPDGAIFDADRPLRENAVAAAAMAALSPYAAEAAATLPPTLGYLAGGALASDPLAARYFVEAYRSVLAPAGGEDAEPLDIERAGTAGLFIIAFAAGVLSFISPCTLPILPAYFAFAFQGDRRRIVVMTLAFFLGLATVFSLMGATASFVGSFIRAHMDTINIVGGALIMAFGLLSLLGLGFEGLRFSFQPARTFAGSFVFGASIAVGWTACVGPILGAILVMASTGSRVAEATALLFTYAMGLGLPLIVVSAVFKNLDKNGKFWQFIRGKGREVRLGGRVLLIHTNNIIAGAVIMALGALVMTGRLTQLNRLLPTSVQAWFNSVEDLLMKVFI